MIRTTDAKEVGVGNTAEETYRCPNRMKMFLSRPGDVNPQIALRKKMAGLLLVFKRITPFQRKKMAEREGFEPSLPFQVITLSRRAPSTTQPPLHQTGAHCVKSSAQRQVNWNATGVFMAQTDWPLATGGGM